MDLYQIISICKHYASLGWAVQEQLNQAMNNSTTEGLNPNAVQMIVRFLRSLPDCQEAYELAETLENPEDNEFMQMRGVSIDK